MDFIEEFYALVDKYNKKKSLPYVDEHSSIEKGDDKTYYVVTLEIEERTHNRNKPTFDNVEHLIEYLKKDGGPWMPADDPNNNPALIGFVKQAKSEDDCKYITIALRSAGMIGKEILKRAGFVLEEKVYVLKDRVTQ
jgi:hypothetical protein